MAIALNDTVLLHPISTEKAIRMMESDNLLTFAVAKKASKEDVKKHFQEMFKVKVVQVNTQIFMGQKKAFIKISKATPAIDIATKLGLM